MPEKRGEYFSYETYKEGEDVVLRIDANECPFFPSIEDNSVCMSAVIDKLVESPGITRVVFNQKRDYEYDYEQVNRLAEVGKLRNQIIKQQLLFPIVAADRLGYELRDIVYNKLRNDPVLAYLELRRIYREEKLLLERTAKANSQEAERRLKLIEALLNAFEKTELITLAKPHLTAYKEGDRIIYHSIFSPITKPDFMFTRLMAAFPQEGEELDSYTVHGTDVTIFKLPSTVQYLYHITPPEFKLSEDKYELLDAARRVISEHKPTRSEFIDPERVRQVFFNVGTDLLEELSEQRRLKLRAKETEELAEILVRYTIGFGLIEVLLKDEKIQDITANSPMGRHPLFIVHQDYDDCMTNIIPTINDADSWATKLRLMSGRPLDEANPILDTELLVPGARARVAVVGEPLNPNGLAYSFRRHRDRPWTFPLFIKNRMMTPLSAGLLSFLIDGSRTMLVAGTRSAGKTSVLGAVMVEIMRKFRVITVEDSVSGDSELIIRKNGKYERVTIGELVDRTIQERGSWYNLTEHEVTGNPENVEVLAMDKRGKVVLSRASKFIRHKVKKPLYAITTKTGRTIKVTGDHSLFSVGETGQIVEAKVKDLQPGSCIAVPRRIELANNELPEIDMFAKILTLEDSHIFGEAVMKFAQQHKAVIKKFGNEQGHGKQVIRGWIRKGLLPGKIMKDLLSLGYHLENGELRFKVGRHSTFSLPARISLDKDFLTFVGLWLADGCYDKRSVIISAVDEEDRAVVHAVGKKFGIPVKKHSDGFSLMLNSKTLKACMRELFELKGDSYTKRLPVWIYQLSKEQIGFVLKGVFSSDGCAAKNEIVIPMASTTLLKDIQFLLSAYDIVFRIGKKRKDGTYNAGISSLKSWKNFRDNIGFLQQYKNQKVELLSSKTSTHDTSDVIPLPLEVKEDMWDVIPKFNFSDYIKRNNDIGRTKLVSILQTSQLPEELSRNLSILAQSDIFWDEVKEVSMLEHEGWVYDISVPECESFVCDNIIAHNTLELPVSALRQLNYNIQPMKVASALTKGTTEVAADEGIRATLRMGDSCLIVGEVRSSIRGDQEVLVVEKGVCKRIPIRDLENKDVSDYSIPTLDFNLKTNLRRLTAFVKHPPREKLLEVRTKTGRRVTVTPDHSLFTATKDLKIVPIECKDLKKGSQVVIPASIPFGFNDVDEINLLEEVPELRVENFEQPVKEAISKIGWKRATEICRIKSGDIYNYFRTNQKTNMPVVSFKELMRETNTGFVASQLLIKTGTSNSLPAVIPVSEDFCSYLGYYVSEGYCELRQGGGGKVIITNSNERVLNNISALTKKLFSVTPREREVFGAGRSVQLIVSCRPLAEFLLKIGTGRVCTEKRVPSLIYGLSKKKIAAFLQALYEGDGSVTVSKSSGNSIRYHTTSQKLAEDVAYLLLAFKIVARIYPAKKRERSNQLWMVEFKDRKMVETFMREIGFVYKNKKLQNRKWAHTKASTVYFDKAVLKQNLAKYTRKYRHLFRFLRCSKNYLEKVVNDPECAATTRLKLFAEGDFYLDEVKEIKELFLPEPEPVYDLSVSPSQNFVGGFGGILLHNTEALALYEAMRVGALANVVAGTIHGDSPYGVFDRVVNDLRVPRTSFKATDVIVVANPIRSPDGLHRWRRLTQITEVGKYWENDPLLEKGFKDLMKYDSKTDQLEPTVDLLNGESDVLKAIAGNVKDWAGSWDAVWDSVLLRTKVKEAIVNAAEKTGQGELLEAQFVVQANDEFHKIAEGVKDETGAYDSKSIFFEWNEWLKKALKRKEIEIV